MIGHRHFRRALLLSAVALAGAGGAQVAGGLSTMEASTSPSVQLAQAMAQIGLRACAPRMQEAADFLFEGRSAAIRVQPLGPDANRWPTLVTIESSHPANGTTRFSTLMIAPAGSCSGFYQQVIVWPQPCAAVKKEIFGSYTGDRALLRNVRISELNAGLQVALMPAGTGCVSIKKELLH